MLSSLEDGCFGTLLNGPVPALALTVDVEYFSEGLIEAEIVADRVLPLARPLGGIEGMTALDLGVYFAQRQHAVLGIDDGFANQLGVRHFGLEVLVAVVQVVCGCRHSADG